MDYKETQTYAYFLELLISKMRVAMNLQESGPDKTYGIDPFKPSCVDSEYRFIEIPRTIWKKSKHIIKKISTDLNLDIHENKFFHTHPKNIVIGFTLKKNWEYSIRKEFKKQHSAHI